MALKEHKGNYETLIPLFLGAKDLAWCIENMDKVFKPISHGNPVIEIRTNASKKGWVHTLMVIPSKACGLVQKASCTSTKATHFTLQAFGKRLKNKHVKILCDNSTAVTYINATGGTKSPSCNQETYDIRD